MILSIFIKLLDLNQYLSNHGHKYHERKPFAIIIYYSTIEFKTRANHQGKKFIHQGIRSGGPWCSLTIDQLVLKSTKNELEFLILIIFAESDSDIHLLIHNERFIEVIPIHIYFATTYQSNIVIMELNCRYLYRIWYFSNQLYHDFAFIFIV